MKKAKKILCVSAIILLFGTLITYFIRFNMLKKEFSEYRAKQFVRAYECLYAKLEEYERTSDSSLSSQISTFMYMLPLSESEMRIAEKFCADISNSETDTEAERRAGMYCEAVMRFLGEERADNYEKGYLTAGIGPPVYEFDGIQTGAVVMPAEDDGKADIRDDAATLLGTERLTRVLMIEDGKRYTVFRTAYSYAVYNSENELVRALIKSHGTNDRENGNTADVKSAERIAADFLIQCGYENMKIVSSEEQTTAFSADFSDETRAARVCVDLRSGRVCLFRVADE